MPTKTTTKKAATKKPAKAAGKTTKKRAPKKGSSARALVCAPNEQCFWTTDGRILQDLRQLHTALEHMSKEVFGHHVTSEKNDFADWVEHVLHDAECAALLRKAKTPKSARTVVVRSLKLYQL